MTALIRRFGNMQHTCSAGLRTRRAIQPLIEALGDFDKSVRAQVMSALVMIGKTAVEPLTSAMKEPQWETRLPCG